MKKFLVVGMLMVASASPVFALDSTMSAKRQEARQEFKAKLQEIKDTRKKMVVDKVNTRMCEIQKKRVATMTANLGRMTEILAKVSTKSAGLTDDKKAAVTTAVNSANTALTEAKAAVAAQEAKKCDIAITGNDQTVKSEVNSARLAFEASIRSTQEKVTAARKSVALAVRALGMALGEKLK